MKNLRQLVRSTGLFGSNKRSSRPKQVLNRKRRLLSESLERRELLAGDVFLASNPMHNGHIAHDVNSDYSITALDANLALNRLGSTAEGESAETGIFPDTNNDGLVTAADVLGIINRLGDAEGQDEIFELVLTARDLNDDPLPVTNGSVDVDVNQEFFLEVAYNDNRTFGAATGAFQLITDLGVSTNGVLRPVLTETQTLSFDGNLRNATAGNFVFTSDDPDATPFTSAFSDFANNTVGEISDALVSFGFTTDQFEIDVSSAGDTSPVVAEIRYLDFDEFGNTDLFNISVEDNLTAGGNPISAPVTFTEVSPLNDDGTINSDAVQFNLFTNSRTFNDDESLYSSNNTGNFNDTDPDLPQGFFTVGGLAGSVPTGGGGIPELTGESPLPRPFDAYSLRVFLDEPITNFVVDVSPGTQVVDDPANPGSTIIEAQPEAVLLYGRDDPLPADEVGIDFASVTFNAIAVGTVNNAPTVAQALTTTVNEQDAVIPSFSLLTGANDADGDTLNVDAFTNTSGNAAGITLNADGNTVAIDPSNPAYDSLNTGESEVVVFNYNIIDGNGGSVAQSLTVTIEGFTDPVANSNPVVAAAVTATFNEDDDPAFVDLLEGASDPDDDALFVTNFQLVSGNRIGIGDPDANGNVSVTPQTYSDLLDAGESEVVTFSYTINDGNGGTVNQSATITIVGEDDVVIVDPGNTAPDAGGPISATFTEDDANSSVDLLQNAFDADGDTLTATATLVSGDDSGITISGNFLNVTPNTYNSLAVGELVTVNYNVVVSDGTATDSTTATVTINGVNDQPVVSAAISQSFLTTDNITTISLLTNASDVDGDTLNVDSPVITGDASGLTINGNTLTIDPSQYTSLAGGASTTATVSYDIIDGNGGSVSQTATITITAPVVVNNPPTVSAPVTATAAENAAVFTVNLLDNSNDVDGDVLNVANLSLQSGDDSGVTIIGNSLAIDPSAYTALNAGESEVIVYSYNVVDGNGGSVAQTATITITGVDDVNVNTIVISQPVTATLSELAAPATFSLLAGASDTSGAALNVVGLTLVSGDDSGVTIAADSNSLTIDPSAYISLNAGETEVIQYSYLVSNGDDTAPQTATFTIVGANNGVAPGSTISGTLFIDHIENFPEVTQGAAPIRNGVRDGSEPGIGGVAVTISSAAIQNDTGTEIDTTLITDLNGSYSFTNVAPGTYTITYDIPDGVVFTGSTSQQVVIDAAGGSSLAGPSLGAISLGSALSNLDIIASSYLRANQTMSLVSDGGLQGGQVVLDSDGNQEMFVASLGLDGIRFAEVALNAQQDAALLTVIADDGTISSARLSGEQFVLGRDGSSVQFFGGLEDFDFVDFTDTSVTSEFETFRNAIDRVLSEGF